MPTPALPNDDGATPAPRIRALNPVKPSQARMPSVRPLRRARPPALMPVIRRRKDELPPPLWQRHRLVLADLRYNCEPARVDRLCM